MSCYHTLCLEPVYYHKRTMMKKCNKISVAGDNCWMQYHFTFKCTRINCSAKEVSYLEKRITCRYFIPYWTWTKTMCLLNKHTTSIDNIFNGKLLLDFSAFRIIVLSINNERKCGLALGYIGMGLEITLLLLCIRKA